MTTFATLCLGSRGDAVTWEKGCTGLGMRKGVSIRTANPQEHNVGSFFSSRANWLYFGGHFGDSSISNRERRYTALYNDAETHEFFFDPWGVDHVDFTKKGKDMSTKYRKDGPRFNLDKSCELILWAGCSMLSQVHRKEVRKFQKLFHSPKPAVKAAKPAPVLVGPKEAAPPELPIALQPPKPRYGMVMLGFRRLTGWKIVDAVLGNGFLKSGHFFDLMAEGEPTAERAVFAWLRAAANAYGTNRDMTSRFAALDRMGQTWILDGKEIVAGDFIK